ncbi:short-chain dehydrogenase/reductase sdr [mine drainage metagenome]|uniref:Short-chain dehydrogenase/reductase sdr n=1 Tax=mine drainage metagenome TaxID=410659 RepID=T1BAM0_9ZZZZ
MDVRDRAKHLEVLVQAEKALGHIDILLIAHGTLSNQRACEASFEECMKELETNCFSVLSLLTHAANIFEAQRSGTIAVIGSVAGDRGRQSNYVYGTAKAAVATFLQGLRNRLHPVGVQVLTIKPGFVDTPMTAHFKKGLLWASPELISAGIYRSIRKKKDVVYIPWFWRWILFGIKMLPESLFKKMKL